MPLGVFVRNCQRVLLSSAFWRALRPCALASRPRGALRPRQAEQGAAEEERKAQRQERDDRDQQAPRGRLVPAAGPQEVAYCGSSSAL